MLAFQLHGGMQRPVALKVRSANPAPKRATAIAGMCAGADSID
jgi:hypothetical protein